MSIVVMPDMIEVEVAVVVIEFDVVIGVESSEVKVLLSVVVLAEFSLSVIVLVGVRDLYTRKMKMEIKLLVTLLLPHISMERLRCNYNSEINFSPPPRLDSPPAWVASLLPPPPGLL